MLNPSAAIQGFVLGIGMFICPGPKDILILKQALAKHSRLELIAVGVLSDAFLIWLGIVGVSAAISKVPILQKSALVFGLLLMLSHGILSAKKVFSSVSEVNSLNLDSQLIIDRKRLFSVIAVSFFNPVAWLDTLLIIGTIGAALPATKQFSFAAGAVIASFVWFFALVFSARAAAHWITSPKAWKILEAFVAVAMIGLAAFTGYSAFSNN